MGVELNVAEVMGMLDGMNCTLALLRSKISNLIINFKQYIEDSNLKSVAYDNHKNYIENMQLPVAEGIREFCERMISANKRYASTVQSYFSMDDIITEDIWREEYAAIKEQYDRINNRFNSILESISALSGSRYYVQTEYAKEYYGANPYDGTEARINYYYKLKVTYQEELELLYGILERYRLKIGSIGEMLAALSGTYDEAGMVKEALAPAIYRLNEIKVTANGDYMAGMADCSVFRELRSCVLSVSLSDKLKDDLGDEMLSAEEFEKLDDAGRLQYANRLSQMAAAYLPSLSGQMADGYIEIPIGLGMTFYLENSATNNLDTNNPAMCEAAYDDNMNVLCTAGVDFGDIALSGNVIENNLFAERQIDDNMKVYIEIQWGRADCEIAVEWGATTTVSSQVGSAVSDEAIHTASVTTACGIKAELRETGLEEVSIDDYALEAPDAPVFNLSEMRELPGPVPIPVPAPVSIPII